MNVVNEGFVEQNIDVLLRCDCGESKKRCLVAADSRWILWIGEEDGVVRPRDYCRGGHGFDVVIEIGVGRQQIRRSFDLSTCKRPAILDKSRNRQQTVADWEYVKRGFEERDKAIGYGNIFRANSGVSGYRPA